MNQKSRILVITAIVGAVVLGALYGLTWLDPARGLERRWEAMLESMEDRDWKRFESYLATDYRDGFRLERDRVVALSEILFNRFQTLSISRQKSTIVVDGDIGVTTGRIRVSGVGDPLAMSIVRGSRFLETPTTFRWRRVGRPWEWELVSLENSEVTPFVPQVLRELDRPSLPIPGL
jgi:hypothetical protein